MLRAGPELTPAAGYKDLTVGIGTDASTLDPHLCTDSATKVINKNIYNNLVRFDTSMKLVPTWPPRGRWPRTA